jgi:hypothetical protein
VSVWRLGLPLVGAALPSLAHAQDVSSLPDVPLAVTGCGQRFREELRASLRIEIDALAQERPDRPRPELVLIRVECAGPGVRKIEVVSREGKRATTELDQSELPPDARIRALALSTTELVDALWTKKPAEPPRAPSSPPVQRPAPRATARAKRLFSLLVGSTAERVGKPGAWVLGGALSLEWPLTGALVSVFEARGQTGTARSEIGSVDVETWTGAVHGLVGWDTGRWRWGVGPGARLGLAILRGESTATLQGDRVRSVWGGPTLKARLVHELPGSPVLLAFGGDAGLVAWGLAGTLDGTRRVFALDGAWVGVTLGVGVSGFR